MTPVVQDLSIAVGVLVALVAGLDVGFRAGRRAQKDGDSAAGSQVGAIQGAVLGLLGLLLAFSFAAAGSRFIERQDLIAQEANAIGTCWLRAELLAEPERSELRAALKAYVEHRIEVGRERVGWDREALAEAEKLQETIWRASMDGVVRDTQLALPILVPVGEVLDLHGLRVNATLKGLPPLVLGLLFSCSLLAVVVIGYGCGMDGQRRWLLTLSLAALIACTLWATFDLDHPRRGLMQLSDAPLEALELR
jgi:hypothetical protein